MDRYEQRGQVTLDPPAGDALLPSARRVVIPLLVCRDCGCLVVDRMRHDRWHALTGSVHAVG